MIWLDFGVTIGLFALIGGFVYHNRVHRARIARIHVEADAYGGRLDQSK